MNPLLCQAHMPCLCPLLHHCAHTRPYSLVSATNARQIHALPLRHNPTATSSLPLCACINMIASALFPRQPEPGKSWYLRCGFKAVSNALEPLPDSQTANNTADNFCDCISICPRTIQALFNFGCCLKWDSQSQLPILTGMSYESRSVAVVWLASSCTCTWGDRAERALTELVLQRSGTLETAGNTKAGLLLLSLLDCPCRESTEVSASELLQWLYIIQYYFLTEFPPSKALSEQSQVKWRSASRYKPVIKPSHLRQLDPNLRHLVQDVTRPGVL